MVSLDHSYTDFKSNLEPLHICKKGQIMNALEEFEIYAAYTNISSCGFILNDQLNFKSNPLQDTVFNLLYQIETNNGSVDDQT